MPVCIMVKILKSGLNSTGCGLLFGLEFLMPVAHCMQLARCPQEA